VDKPASKLTPIKLLATQRQLLSEAEMISAEFSDRFWVDSRQGATPVAHGSFASHPKNSCHTEIDPEADIHW
jgi:hypothetical protein